MESGIEPQVKPVVLVIDPDPLTMTGVAAALHLAGYESHCARDRQAAMKAASSISFDLILCDVNVEGDRGVEICGEIHSVESNRDVPVMYISANQAPDIIRRSDEAGGVYYLRKPFDPSVMLALVEKALWMPHLVKNRLQRQDSQSELPQPKMSEQRSTNSIQL